MDDGFPSTRATTAFERRVARALNTYVSPAAPLLVACSGGPDSSATLIALARSSNRDAGRTVIAACFDHGLRPAEQTAGDRAAVEALARRLRVAFVMGAAPGGAGAGGSEAAARDRRYRWLAAACLEAGVSWCATGHTLDDQAETVLLRMTRGTGLRGASGMVAASPWPVSCDQSTALRLVRPLLGIRRAEAAAYLVALGVEARSDPTNLLLDFDRNRVRHRVLPELRAVNPRAEEALARFSTLARSDDEALEAWAEAAGGSLVRLEAAEAVIERAGLRALPAAVASRVLRRAGVALGIGLEAEQVEALLRLAGRRGSRLSLDGGQAEVLSDVVRVSANPKS